MHENKNTEEIVPLYPKSEGKICRHTKHMNFLIFSNDCDLQKNLVCSKYISYTSAKLK